MVGDDTPAGVAPVGREAFPARGVNSLAPFSARALARSIDALVLAGPYLVVAFVTWMAVAGFDVESTAEEIGLSVPEQYLLLVGPAVALALVYETLCTTLWGQTAGKAVMGIRVARLGNGRCPLWWESALRIAVPGLVIMVPHGLAMVVAAGLYLVAGFDPMGRSIPDKAAGTVVVRSR